MKIISVFCYLLLPWALCLAQAPVGSDIEVVGKLESLGSSVRLVRSVEGDAIPSVLEDENLMKVIRSMRPGDDALVRGHISYVPSAAAGETNLVPVFVITGVKTVSLKRLADALDAAGSERPIPLRLEAKVYSPQAIPVSTEVASALTVTGSMLLMHSLTAGGLEPMLTRELNQGLIIFAGALMTGTFIYKQLTSAKPKE